MKNNSNENKHQEGFTAGLILGGIIGAALAYILEDQGIEVRDLVKKKAHFALKTLKETAHDGQEVVEKNARIVKENVQDGLEVVEKKVVEKKEEIAKVVSQPKKSSSAHRSFFKLGKKLAK